MILSTLFLRVSARELAFQLLLLRNFLVFFSVLFSGEFFFGCAAVIETLGSDPLLKRGSHATEFIDLKLVLLLVSVV